MKENHKQQEKSFARWNDYVKRTSDHRHLVASKKKQDKSIESSRAKPKYREHPKQKDVTFHETLSKSLNTLVNFYTLFNVHMKVRE